MGDRALHDVRPDQYATEIREFIRHEDDVTNHRITWLLIVQGLLANASLSTRENARGANGLALAGVLVALSAFVALYKSYQARGYLRFLGAEAKAGRLREEYLEVEGWPSKRIRGWQKGVWLCPWLEQLGDLLEPYFFLPFFIVSTWVFLVLQRLIPRSPWTVLGLSVTVTILIFATVCGGWVRLQGINQERAHPRATA